MFRFLYRMGLRSSHFVHIPDGVQTFATRDLAQIELAEILPQNSIELEYNQQNVIQIALICLAWKLFETELLLKLK